MLVCPAASIVGTMTSAAEASPPEIVHSIRPSVPARAVFFDFDGTLSLLRGNWQGLMIPRMVEILAATGTREPRAELETIVTEFVTRLTGQPTMVQMQALADEVASRGKPRPDPRVHFAEYLERLLARTAERTAALQAGRIGADELLVPGARSLVERLARRGLLLAIFSGTELSDVRRELAVLGLGTYFGPRIFGPVDNDPTFS